MFHRRDGRRIPLVVDHDRQRLLPLALTSTRHHADLQGEQLVERKAQRGQIVLDEIGREMHPFQRLGDRWRFGPSSAIASAGMYSSKDGSTLSSAARIFVRR